MAKSSPRSKRKIPPAAESEPMVSIEGVSQVFRNGFWLRPVTVLNSLSFSVRRGAVFGFLGANGAGKTTLIHLIVGLRVPSAGSVSVLGVPAHYPEAKMRIGYLPERPYFHEHLTGEGLLTYFGRLSGMKSDRLRRRIPEALSLVGMSDAAKTELGKYSKGMLQRVGIAQAILHDPELLVLDEPMSGLDPVGRKEIRELILSLAARGKTIFFSSHVIPDVEAICHEVALIHKGKLVGSGSIEELLREGQEGTQIVVRGIEEEDARELAPEWKSFSGGLACTVKGKDELGALIKGLVALRAEIVSVTPLRPSLETYFKEASLGR